MRVMAVATVVLCLMLATSGAWAGKTLNVKRLGDPIPAQIGAEEASRQDCQVGNLNAPVWLIGDWVVGLEGYKYLFYPPETCGSCPVGFHLETVHLLMNFGPEDVPANFEIYVDLEEAVWDDGLGCWFPGPEVCISQPATIQIDVPGTYDIGVSIADECSCAYMDYYYLLSFHFLTSFGPSALPDLLTDEFPLGCRSWNDFGAGWLDVVTAFGWPGELIMYGDVSCCELPIAEEPRTWGGVKSLYR